MQDIYALLRPDERVTLALRSLYEKYGYRKFRMNRFEEYDFYAGYRDFLASGQIISFTDLDGKLMALRPDVTLSIVKKVQPTGGSERLYYTESVFRPTPSGTGYRESAQVGLEYIGDLTAYATTEIVSLAAQSLALISAESVLDLSHTGYVNGLLDGIEMSSRLRKDVRRCLDQKNAHELAALTEGTLPEETVQRLVAVARLSGPFAETLQKARALAVGDAMLVAVDELEALYQALSAAGEANPLRLDFSISSDAKYYSGLMMRGYVSGIPSAVLSGGQYDPLLRRMGKPQLSALGFAIYFDELARFLTTEADASVDTVIRYGPETSPAAVAHVVQSRIARGERVWAGTSLPAELSYKQVLEVDGHA